MGPAAVSLGARARWRAAEGCAGRRRWRSAPLLRCTSRVRHAQNSREAGRKEGAHFRDELQRGGEWWTILHPGLLVPRLNGGSLELGSSAPRRWRRWLCIGSFWLRRGDEWWTDLHPGSAGAEALYLAARRVLQRRSHGPGRGVACFSKGGARESCVAPGQGVRAAGRCGARAVLLRRDRFGSRTTKGALSSGPLQTLRELGGRDSRGSRGSQELPGIA